MVIRAPNSAATAQPVPVTEAVEGSPTVDASILNGSAAMEAIKWKKIARKVLETQPGGVLKLKRLQSLASAAAKMPAGVDAADAASSLEVKLRRSSMFVFQGKRVSLAKR